MTTDLAALDLPTGRAGLVTPPAGARSELVTPGALRVVAAATTADSSPPATPSRAGAAAAAAPSVGRRRPLLLLGLLGGGLAVLTLPPVRELLSPAGVDALREVAADAGPLELAAGTLVAAGLVALGAPRLLLAGVAGAALGTWLGGALAVAAGALGSLVCFAAARCLGRDWARARLAGRLPGLDAACRRRGLLVTLLLRASPVGFGQLTTVALAVSSVGVGDFLLGTALGVAPSTLLVAGMGRTAAVGSWPQLASGIVLLGGLMLLLRRLDPWSSLDGAQQPDEDDSVVAAERQAGPMTPPDRPGITPLVKTSGGPPGDDPDGASSRKARPAVGLGRSRPLVARLVRAFLRCGAYMPLWSLQLVGRGIGQLAGWLPTRSRSRCLANLRVCLPELSAREHRRLARRSLGSMGSQACELPAFWSWSRQELLEQCRETEGLDVLDDAVAAGRGVLLMVPHLGAWELSGLFCSTRHPVTALFRPSRLREMDAELCAGRGRFGAHLVPAGVGAVRSLLRALKRGEIAVMLPDTDPKHGQSVFAPFFGEPANTGILLPRLARDSGATVVLCVIERLGLGRGFRPTFRALGPELSQQDTELAAAAMNLEVERAIRRLPEQYLWRYRRFRRRPPGLPCLYGEDGSSREARA